MRKQQISILSALPADEIRSSREIRLQYDELEEVPPKLLNEIESKI